MNKLNSLKCLTIIAVYAISFTTASNANWQTSDKNNTTPHTQYTQNTPHSNSDSLPNGVSQDWLNSLTDENGDRIINEEEPETDALQQQTFDGVVAGDEYGRSVSTAGDVNGDGFDDVIIGAPKNNAGGISSGRVYIFFGGTVINNSVDVILTGGAVNNYFGRSVSSAGDVNSDGYDDVIVGADGYSSFAGRAYIYYGGVSMNSVADVTMTGEFTGHNFGNSVSGAGDVNNDGFSDVIVGAYGSNTNTGKAYVYFGGVSMNNIADVTFTGETPQSNFGSSVSGAGDVNGDGYHDVIIGANGYNSDIGKAYIYFGGTSMDNIADVNMFGGTITDFFGASVSNAGDVNDDGYSDVIVGAYGYSSSTGRAYIFYGGAAMDGNADVTMTGEAVNNLFGYSVSDAGDVNGDGYTDVYVGAYGFSLSKGRSYLFYGGTSMNNTVDIYMTGDTTLNLFGYSVSGGGDVNGDGFADMIAGAYGKNLNTGRAYVYTNTVTGEDIPDLCITGEDSLNLFGRSVSSAGDVNGDGYDDVIVGASGYNLSDGRAYIFYGGVTVNNIADVILSGNQTDTGFGFSVSSAGDVNNDGYSDVIVGAGTYFQKIAHIFLGGAAMNNIIDVTLTIDNIIGYNLFSISEAGDVNGDGYDDVIVGDPYFDNQRGRCYVYFGGAAMNNTVDVTFTGETSSSYFSYSVSSAGDVNKDGYDDIIVGAFGYFGNAYIFYGGATMNNIADVTLTGELMDYSRFGYSVSGAGDVNGDGFDDVIVGAYAYDQSTGRVYIFHGGFAMNNIPDLILTGISTYSDFGIGVSSAGDVNNDGYDDVIISSHFPAYDKSKAFIYLGDESMNNISDIIITGEYGYIGSSTVSISAAGDINSDGYDDVIIGWSFYNNKKGIACIHLSSPPDNRKNLLLFGAIQGMYDPVLDTEIPDTIKVYLRNSTSPFARVDSSKNILLGSGTGQQFLFRNVQNDKPYFIEVTHRNALTTWSANTVSFVNSDASIAFSVDDIYAYGNNEVQVDNSPYDVFAFYSGDVNQDGVIDLADVLAIYNAANNFLTGYVSTDLNGNNLVDLTDLLFAYNNSVNFVSVINP